MADWPDPLLQLSIDFWINHYTASLSWQTDPTPSSNWAYISGKPLHQISFIYSRMHIVLIFARQTPLLQSSIDLWKTTSLHNLQDRLTPPPPPIEHRFLEKPLHCITFMADWPHPPPAIDHRFMQDHFTNYISHIDVCTDTSADRPHPPPPINHRSMVNHYTDYISHIDVCTDTSVDRPHPLLQLTIDLWKTTTLTVFHI